MKHSTALSGRQLHMTAGDMTATVVQVGAGLRDLEVAGRPLLDGYGQDEIAAYAQGQALVPWPNRLADGAYAFAGTEYPFTLRAEVEYTLTSAGIGVQTTLTNAGTTTLPAGHGFHPYVTVGTDHIDDTQLQLPVASRLDADDRGIPTGRRIPVDGTQYDFREPRLIGELKLDTAFTDMQRDDDGCARIRLTAPGADRHAELWLDDTYDFVMAFTGDSLPDPARRRRALGLEPMTCAPNAFRSGDGLRTLQPGEATASRWGFARVEF
jgi:aldose 1-epimerase